MTDAVPFALLALGALATLTIAVIALRALPRGGFLAWSLVLFLVPVWVGASVGLYWPAVVLLAVISMIAYWTRVPWHLADGVMAVFVALVIGLLVLGGVGLSAAVTAVMEWVIPFAWGRIVLARSGAAWVTSAISAVAVVAAVLAIIEFATSFNVFILIPGVEPLYSAWNTLQPRGGVIRAEGAFGHSIALGATLAMSTAFVIANRWPLVPKVLAFVLIAAATVLTFSRAGLITMVLTVVLGVSFMPGVSRRFRLTAIAGGAVGAAVAVPLIDSVLSSAGDEAAGSAGYRTDLLVLVSQVELFGNSGEWQTLVSGDYYLGNFANSVDNALVLSLLRYGFVPTLLAITVIVLAIVAGLRRERRNPAALAVLGQLPSLVVVALITQYGIFLWFCVGLAVAWSARPDEEGFAGTVLRADQPRSDKPVGLRPGSSPDR